MKVRLLRGGLLAIALTWHLGLILPVRADPNTFSFLLYPAGWNMVGVPLGTGHFVGAEQVRGLGTVSNRGLTLSSYSCRGYWVRFSGYAAWSAPEESPSPATKTCHLHRGRNLIGNPFLTGAMLPPGVHGSYWNTDRDAYATVHEIPLGAAVSIRSRMSRTITLRAAPQTPTIALPPADAQASIPPHVPAGSVIQLLRCTDLNAPSADADPRHLILERSTQRLGGPPACYTWQWRATKPGKTTIEVNTNVGGIFPYPIVVDPSS